MLPLLISHRTIWRVRSRAVKLTFSEYLKSQLLNNDSRFRKNAEFVFYYLWQKELRELSAGIYNVLNSTNRRNLCVKQFIDGINDSDAGIQANISTVLQLVRGTEQVWFLKKIDVMAMIKEFGSSTLFLTFSCAEYDSPDIYRYLQRVNKVPDSYPITKLCTENPISVSRKFTQKVSTLFYISVTRWKGTWRSHTLFLEEGIPVQGCSTLSCSPLD